MEKLFNYGKAWTDKDTEYVLNHFNHMRRDYLIMNLGRTWESIRSKYYIEMARINKKKLEELSIGSLSKECLNCGSTNVNQVNSYRVKNDIGITFYCKDCLMEYNQEGVLEPLWE